MALGSLALVLHAHLPFVRHPECDYVLEEEWLFEAITEAYVPLLRVLEGWEQDGIDFKLTFSLTPPLLSMLRDRFLQERYDRYLSRQQDLVRRETQNAQRSDHIRYLAGHYADEFAKTRDLWERYDWDLVRAFRHHLERNNLEIITCAATHGYLPLMRVHPEAVWAQIEAACEHYKETFARPPRGIWLPESAYYEGLEHAIAAAGLRYFIMDGHGLLYGRPRPRYGTYAPVFTAAGVAAFGRDHESSQQVWSAEVGYPGDPVYREFYRDLGWEADYDYIRPYIMPDGQRKNTGIKYHRITQRDAALEDKALYDPYWAREKAAVHAADFTYNRQRQVRELARLTGRAPIVVSPYDAELFGHWWYEGPWFLDYLVRKSWYDQEVYQLTHLADYLREHPTQQLCQPSQSSWGYRGFHEFWLNESNAWIYPHLHKAAERMVELARREARGPDELAALNQAARELLLAQSSDWAFIMRTGTVVSYAVRRTRSHLQRFNKLYTDITAGTIDLPWLAKVEQIDNIFPQIDYRIYRGSPSKDR